MKLSLRARFALLAGILVFAVASLAALGGYLAMRTSLLHRAARTAQSQAAQVATMVDVSAPTGSQDAAGAQTNNQGNTVDINDPALTHLRGVPGTLIDVRRKDGTRIQASSTVLLPSAFSRRCLSSGHAQMRVDQPPLALACQRAGPSSGTLGGLITVGAPLADAFASLRTLRTVLIFGVLSGALLSAGLALIVARRALRPVRRIAETAETIRGGDLARRIGYQGSDELGRLAAVLDACFDELEQALERQRRFGADASHELRTPIAAIRANVELLRGWAGADPVARQAAIASLDQASRRAARLVEDLLFLARL
ncbi:MAG TPA: HAMP domain-containing sensor histidine kinase, partial [Solirubrobacteraceae bacterium]